MVGRGSSSSGWQQVRSFGVLSVLLCTIMITMTSAAPQPFSPRGVCSYPPQMMGPAAQRICKFIEEYKNLGELTEALEEFLDAKVERSVMPLSDPEVKRQDLDHVFLRFGRTHHNL
ncbi:uncharacterized protein LOC108683360 [Hyalella azteca]|uniref:Uncharacterized protein LOC108683360 n=1 Tax=Hyalella azteca TaxID=294128 RepID=A0A8B7PSJ4_HYAAZ|nr:uncharacterized protein LOC108683360 [Hyalella azteca]